MENSRKSIIILTQNSFKDPLFYGTVVSYLKEISETNKFNFYLISFELKEYKQSSEEITFIQNDLLKYNMFWRPFNWKGGSLIVFKKILEFINCFIYCFYLVLFKKAKALYAHSVTAGTYGLIISKIFRIKLIVFTYEPLSEFMEECGVWNKNSFKFKLQNYFEYLCGVKADYIATGTQYMVERLKQWKSKAEVYRVPSCIDEDLFCFRKDKRIEIRDKLSLNDKNVFIYAGKFGDVYYKDEIGSLLFTVQQFIKNPFFIILTPNNRKEIEQLLISQKVDLNKCFISKVSLNEVPDYLSASDIGIVAVPPLPSQKFRSPIKVGEYLCCGIPYIVCEGISEDDLYAKKYNVGVVVKDFSADEIKKGISDMEILLKEDKEIQRQRCRVTGIEYRSKKIAVDVFKKIFIEV
jgi:hypothetical protein